MNIVIARLKCYRSKPEKQTRCHWECRTAGPGFSGLPFYPWDGGSEFWYAIPTVRGASFHPKFWLDILEEEGFLIWLNSCALNRRDHAVHIKNMNIVIARLKCYRSPPKKQTRCRWECRTAGPGFSGLPFYPRDGGSEFWYGIPTVRGASFHPTILLAILGEEGFLILLNI